MTVHPGGEEIRLVFIDCFDQGSDFGRWARGES